MTDVNTAFRELRTRLGHTQQSFAGELDLALRTVTHYEKDRVPPLKILNSLAVMADKNGHADLCAVFVTKIREEVGDGIMASRYQMQAVLDFACLIANMTADGELDGEGRAFVMDPADAVKTLNELIAAARKFFPHDTTMANESE